MNNEKYRLQDLVDMGFFQTLQEKLNKIYNFPSAIIDDEGMVLTASGWQEVCTKFHRLHPEAAKECVKSDQYIVNHLHEANPSVCYQCPHGLIDTAIPIIVDGEHYGSFFTGQFFFDTPNLGDYRKRAEMYGFNESAYIKAVEKVPVWTKEQLDNYHFFVKGIIEIISGTALKAKNEIRFQEELIASQSLYHDLVDTAQDLIWQCDAEGRYIFLNPAWETVFGYKIEEMLGKKFTDFQAPEWAARDLKEFERLMKGNTVKGLETVHLAKNGEEINLVFNAKFIRDIDGNILGTRGTAFDLTEFRKMEHSLRENEKKYRSLIASMNEGLALHKVVYDTANQAIDYEIIEVNTAFERQTGISNEVVKNKLASVVYNVSPAPYLDQYAEVAQTGKPIQFETYFPPLDKHFDISVFSPEKGWFATIFSDITNRKKTDEKIQFQLTELKRFNAIMVEREIKMIQLKQEVNALCKQLKLPDKYQIPSI